MRVTVVSLIAAATPDSARGVQDRSKAFEIPGLRDGANPLGNRSLSSSERLTGGYAYLTKYCQERRCEIDRIADGFSKEEAFRELVSVLRFVIDINTNGPEMLKRIDAKALMGERMVGPDATIFAGHTIGLVPPLPENIAEILSAPCGLFGNGRTVAETHRLVLIPQSIDGVPISFNSLQWFAEAIGNPVYDPGSGGETSVGFEAFLKERYVTADAFDAIGVLALRRLECGGRDFSDDFPRTSSFLASGAPVHIGHSVWVDGIVIGRSPSDLGPFGRAVCWKFE